MGTRTEQAHSVSHSDSESRNKNEEIIPVNRLTPTVCTDPPAPATTIRTALLNKGHSFRRLAQTVGIGVGTGICRHYTTRILWPETRGKKSWNRATMRFWSRQTDIRYCSLLPYDGVGGGHHTGPRAGHVAGGVR
jgi:hypothetical protein